MTKLNNCKYDYLNCFSNVHVRKIIDDVYMSHKTTHKFPITNSFYSPD